MNRSFRQFVFFYLCIVGVWCAPGCFGFDFKYNVYGITVPDQLRLRHGNTNSYMPLLDNFGGDEFMHYQQVFAASEFPVLPPGGAYLEFIRLRTDCLQTLGIYSTTNFNIWFSTTHRQPDQLSAIFAENVGSDATLVRSRTALFGMADSGCPNPGPEYPLGPSIEFDVPFVYNPSQGNLLMEIKVLAKAVPRKRFILDAENVVGDGISRAVGRGFSSQKADIVVDSVGILVFFGFHGPPLLSVQREKAGITVGWYDRPSGFHLEWSAALGAPSEWKTYPLTSPLDPDFKLIPIPAAQLGKTKYFRLIHPTLPSLGNPPPPVSSQPHP